MNIAISSWRRGESVKSEWSDIHLSVEDLDESATNFHYVPRRYSDLRTIAQYGNG